MEEEKRDTEAEVLLVVRKEEWTETDARFLLNAQKASGKTPTEFARAHGFIPQRLYRWDAKLKRAVASKTPAAKSKAFVPVRLVGPRGTGGTLEVSLGRGRSIRVDSDFDAGLLQRVVAALEEAPC